MKHIGWLLACVPAVVWALAAPTGCAPFEDAGKSVDRDLRGTTQDIGRGLRGKDDPDEEVPTAAPRPSGMPAPRAAPSARPAAAPAPPPPAPLAPAGPPPPAAPVVPATAPAGGTSI